jgi:uncharacterized alkaline shock family protein YloU
MQHFTTGGGLKEQKIVTQPTGEYAGDRGKTTITPEVMLTIAQLTTLSVPGVSAMSNVAGGVNRLFKRGAGEGVRMDIREDMVYVDLYLILNKDVNIRDTSRRVQREVARAISEMVGLQVGRVNIHIEDIDYSVEANLSSPQEA